MLHSDWIKQIDQTVLALDEKPQLGSPVEFSWEQFEKGLKEAFEKSDLSLAHEVKGWTDASHLFTGMGTKIKILTVHWTPLETPIYFATTEQDIQKLMSIFLGGEETSAFFYENGFMQAFYDYFGAEVLRVLAFMGLGSPLAPRLGKTFDSSQDFPLREPCFLTYVSLSSGKTNIWGRFFFSHNFREDWKTYFLHNKAESLTEEARRKISVDVALEIGHTKLSNMDLRKIRAGDFVLLDHCSFNPDTNKGSVLLTLGGRAILRARFKDEGIKITNYPAYEEVSEMAENNFGQEEEDFLEDEDLFSEFTENEDESNEAAGEHLLNDQASIDVESLPIQLTVEIARLKMTVQQIAELSPGNTLELNVTPQQGVDLVVNGKKVGRGELIKVGELLGVRILSL